MFEFGFGEMLLTAVVALLVLGPKRLPVAARTLGLWMRRARASWFSLRAELERELADEDIKASLREAREEMRQLKRELEAPLVPERALPAQAVLSAVQAPPEPAASHQDQSVPAAEAVASDASTAVESSPLSAQVVATPP